MSTMPLTASISITIDHSTAALITSDNHMMATHTLPSLSSASVNDLQKHILAAHKQIIQVANGKLLAGFGIVLSTQVLTKTNAQAQQLQDNLQDTLKLPIIVERDMNVIALAETQINSQHHPNTVIYLHVDSHIEGVIVQGGHLWENINTNSDHIAKLVAGWMSTKPITLGERASGQGIANEYNMRSKTHRTPSLDEIIQYAKQGDHLAIRVIRDGAHLLGSVSYPALMLLNPDLVIVGGRFAMSGDLWWQNFSDAFLQNRDKGQGTPQLVRAKYDDDALLYYAAILVRNRLQHDKQ